MTVTSDKKTDEPDNEPVAEAVDEAADQAEADLPGEADADAETETDTETDAEESESQPLAQRSRQTRIVVGLLAVLCVAALAVSGFLGWKLWQQDQVTQAGRQAQATAVSYAQILTSIDTDKVDENFNQVLDGATGEFKDMYSASSMQLRQLLIENKAAAHGVVIESAIQSASKDKVVVLLFVDQSISNSNMPDPRLDRSRIKMTMEKVDGRWKTSKVELP